jgi:microcin C transport system permease protein
MSPEYKEKLIKFKKNRKAYYSLIILAVLFIVSMPAELLFNDKPLVLKVNEKYYFPFINDYSMADFGGVGDIPVSNYKTGGFQDFLNGKEKKKLSISDLFGEDDDLDDEIPEESNTGVGATTPEEERVLTPSERDTKKDYFFVWAPVWHSHKSKNENPKTGREALAAPWDEYIESQNRTYKSSIIDQHYLGTDKEGKDVFARIVYGFRTSMIFGLGIALTGTVLGCLLGALQGYFGGWLDIIGQRLTELWGSLPRLFLLIILSSFLASHVELSDFKHYLLLFSIINLTAWMGMATFMRAEFLKARNLDYVKAAKALGASNSKIMLRHILPNSLTPIITFFPFRVTGGILALVSLDFLALGVKYPAPSLGELLRQGQENLHALWIIIPTFCVLSLSLTLLTFIGDGVRNAFDPRST